METGDVKNKAGYAAVRCVSLVKFLQASSLVALPSSPPHLPPSLLPITSPTPSGLVSPKDAFLRIRKKALRTDGRTDRRTDRPTVGRTNGRTDRPSYMNDI